MQDRINYKYVEAIISRTQAHIYNKELATTKKPVLHLLC